MIVRGNRALMAAAAAAVALTLGAVGFSYADNVFDTGLTVADDAATEGVALEQTDSAHEYDDDARTPEIDLFGGDDDETEEEEAGRSPYWLELRDKSTEPRLVGDKGDALELRINNMEANRDELPEVAWTSSDPAIVSIDKNGAMHYNAAGTATITAEYHGATTSADITVQVANFRFTHANGQSFRTNELVFDFNDDVTVQMLNDYTATTGPVLGAKRYVTNLHVTLDLGGHTLTISPESGVNGLLVSRHNSLTIKNGTINIQTPDDRSIAGLRVSASDLILEDGVIANAFGNASVVKLGSTGVSTLKSSATLTSQSAPAVLAASVKNTRLYEDQVDILKGTVEATNAPAIQFDGLGTLGLGDAEIKGRPAIAMSNGTLNADKGDIEGVEDAGILVSSPATAVISGGVTVKGAPSLKIDDAAAYGEGESAVTIKGGQFSDDAGNGEGFVLPEGKELAKDDGESLFTLKDKKPEEPKRDDEQDDQKKNEGFSCAPAVWFNGSVFMCSLEMHNLEIEADGRGCEDYVVEAWYGDDKAGFRTDYPTGRDCGQICLLPIAPKDVLETVHYRVYYKGGTDPIASVDTTIDAIVKDAAAKESKGEDATKPMAELCESAHTYGTLLSHYSDEVNGGKVDAAGDEALKAKLADVVVPVSEAPKVAGGSKRIKLTSASLTFGDTATVNFCFTPAEGYKAGDIETTVDGAVVSDGKNGSNKAIRGTVTRRVLDDGRLCLSISGIYPESFAHRFQVSAGSGTDVKQLDYSVLSYLYLNQQVEGLGDICKALYSYYLAACAA